MSYNGKFRLPLLLAQGSPFFHLSCQGELGGAKACLTCGQWGHWKMDCPQRRPGARSLPPRLGGWNVHRDPLVPLGRSPSPQWGTVHGTQPSSRALCTEPPSGLPCSPFSHLWDHSLSGPGLWPSPEATPSLLISERCPLPTKSNTNTHFIHCSVSISVPICVLSPGRPQIWVPLGSAWPRNCPHPLIQQIGPADDSTLQFSPHAHSLPSSDETPGPAWGRGVSRVPETSPAPSMS